MKTRLPTLALLVGALLGAGCASAPAPGAAFPTPPMVGVDEGPPPAGPPPPEQSEPEPEPEPEGDGTLWGDSIGEAFGEGGLGLEGIGDGGGGTGEGIGLGSLGGLGHGGGKGGTDPSTRAGAAAVVGALAKDDIRQVIRRHTKELRFCFERALQSARPDLEGRVVVRFTIGADGSVIAHQVSEGLEPDLDVCVERVFARMQFPAPTGGGVVVVSYPLIFRAATGDASAAPSTP